MTRAMELRALPALRELGALADLLERAADGGGDGYAVDDVAGLEAGDDGAVGKRDAGDRGDGGRRRQWNARR